MRTVMIAVAILTPLAYLVVVPLWRYYSLPAKDRAVLAALEARLDMPFGDPTPLEGVLKYLKMNSKTKLLPSGIPIYVDPVGLNEAEKNMQSPVRIQTKGARLKTSLKTVLNSLGLDYTVKDGLLVITSKESLDVDLR